MANKDGVILYISQFEAVEELSDEELGKLYRALFNDRLRSIGKQPKKEVELDGMTKIAYNFLANQLAIDAMKYEEISRKRSEAGKKGGAPKGNSNASKSDKTSKTSKNKQNKPNENENENENEKKNDNERQAALLDSSSSFFGHLGNVRLTESQHTDICETFDDPNGLIDKVSLWLAGAKNDVPDHYALCLKFAANSNWTKKRKIKPPPPEREIAPEDMPTDEERAEMVANINRKIGFKVIGE